MKNRLNLLLSLSLVLIIIMLSACTDVSNNIKPPSEVKTESTTAPLNETVEPTSSSIDENTNDTNIAADGDNSSNDISIAETVLYDVDGIKITATGYKEGWTGPEITMLVENNSQSNIIVSTDSVSVNGYMTPLSSLYSNISAGKKSNESLNFLSTELERSGIDTISEVQFYISISDADSWDKIAESELITLSTSVSDYEQEVDDSGDTLYEKDNIRIICKGLKQDIIWDGTIVFYMENNSGAPITVYAENVSVNSFMQSASLWSNLRNNTRLIDGMSLLDLSDLELNSIDEIQNIEFSLRIINSDTWEEIATTDAITLNFG